MCILKEYMLKMIFTNFHKDDENIIQECLK